jgi:DNA-directed RNA polymerase specialized sigma24 family protein
MASPGRPPQAGDSADAFRYFLKLLGPDLEAAGTENEKLRRKLTMYFRGRRCEPFAEELTDRTLDRAAFLLYRDRELEAAGPGPLEPFIFRVARFIFLEWTKQPKNVALNAEYPTLTTVPVDVSSVEDHLQSCLNSLTEFDRKLAIEYYDTPRGQAKIDAHKSLAARLGMEPNALRQRVFQIRRAIEKCIERKEKGRQPI